jgi:hypothetical protein
VNDFPEELSEPFANLIFHLGQMAALALGDLADASGQRPEPNPEAAGMFVEMLGSLQEKTSGNLTAQEAKLLDDLLYELRLRYVQIQGNQKRIIEP